jgi:hypothetical protein
MMPNPMRQSDAGWTPGVLLAAIGPAQLRLAFGGIARATIDKASRAA